MSFAGELLADSNYRGDLLVGGSLALSFSAWSTIIYLSSAFVGLLVFMLRNIYLYSSVNDVSSCSARLS